MLEDLEGEAQQLVPFGFFVAFEVETDGLDGFENGLDSAVGVGLGGVSVIAQDMLYIVIRVLIVFKEVPVLRRTELVHEPSLLHVLHSNLLILFSLLATVGLLPSDSLFLVILDELTKFVSLKLFSFKTLKQDEVLDVLAHMLIDVFKRLNCSEPSVLLFGVVVLIPDPGPAPL